MTRESKKESERHILDQYFKALNQPYTIIQETERPDFIIQVGKKRIGVEITGYHETTRLHNGLERRVVEAQWERLRDRVADFYKTRPEMPKASVFLDFIEPRVPSDKESQSFIDAVSRLIESRRSELSEQRQVLCIRIDSESPGILHRFIKTVQLKKASGYREWRWNYNFKGVGTSDQEMLAFVKKKLNSNSLSKDIDAYHLVIAGWGGNPSEIAAPLSVEQLENFTNFNEAIEKSPFDVVAILCLRSFFWGRQYGWKNLSALGIRPF